MELNPDRTSATLAVSGSFDTTRLENLIGELLVLRAHMEPPVPYTPPHRDDPGSEDAHVSVQNDPYLQLGRRGDGGLRLFLRHMGLGWMVYEIPAAKAATIRDFLASKIDARNAFVAKQLGDGDATH